MADFGIETMGLTKRYGPVTAVLDLNLKIPRGELFAFLGPNGAGKTTTIRILAGLLKPSSGEIRIGGLNPQDDGIAVKRKLGYIPDLPFFYDRLTPYEFMSFMGSFYQAAPSKIKVRQEELLKQFDLIEFQDQLIESLSHGMKRRLNFCATLLHDPEVLLVDEPMVGLDPKSSKMLRETLSQLSKNGVSIFLSTHTLSLAEELAHRIGVIHHGKLIALGTLEELKVAGKNAKDLESAFLQITDAL